MLTSTQKGKLKRTLGGIEPVTKRKIISTKDKSKKFVTMHQMHVETLEVLNDINKSLLQMNNIQNQISTALELLVERNSTE